jgi:hypothetical protein
VSLRRRLRYDVRGLLQPSLGTGTVGNRSKLSSVSKGCSRVEFDLRIFEV